MIRLQNELRSAVPSHHIEVVEYDPNWPEQFVLERDAVAETIAPWLNGPIQHVGSTAVPGLCAKPVIDILIPVRTLADSRPAIAVLEKEHGYTYWPYDGNGNVEATFEYATQAHVPDWMAMADGTAYSWLITDHLGSVRLV